MFLPKVTNGKILQKVIVFEPSVHIDERGTLFSSYTEDFYKEYLPQNVKFIHDKFAESKFNVLRGLHGDNKTWKLISCIFGEIYEVVVDYDPNSDTYLKWESFELTDSNKKQILVPPNYLNGYFVKSDKAIFHYKLAYHGEYIDANQQLTIKWNDPALNIDWPCETPILQERDK